MHDSLPQPPPQIAQELSRRAPESLDPAIEAALIQQIEARTEASGLRDRLRALPGPARAALAVLGIALLTAGFTAMEGPRHELFEASGAALAARILAVGLVAMGGAFVALRGQHRTPLRARALALVGVALAAPVLASLLPGVWPGFAGSGSWNVARQGCFWGGLMTGAGTAAGLLWLDRAERPSVNRIIAAAAAGGGVAFVVQTLHCPMNDVAHMVGTHGTASLPIVALGLIAAAALGRKSVSPSRPTGR